MSAKTGSVIYNGGGFRAALFFPDTWAKGWTFPDGDGSCEESLSPFCELIIASNRKTPFLMQYTWQFHIVMAPDYPGVPAMWLSGATEQPESNRSFLLMLFAGTLTILGSGDCPEHQGTCLNFHLGATPNMFW
jgi:hypothetical protein